jgi:hypothetical protein
MTTGLTRVFILLFTGAFLPLQVGADALLEVMQSLSEVKRAEVDYQEEKHLAMLDVPLMQSGHLSYVAPQRFIRTLDKPVGGRFTIDGETVILEQGGSNKQQSLEELPLVKAFVASFGATLAGDLPRLQQHYQIKFDGNSRSWKLYLQPKDRQLASFISEIRLWGRHDKVDGMEIDEANGDWSRMILLHD